MRLAGLYKPYVSGVKASGFVGGILKPEAYRLSFEVLVVLGGSRGRWFFDWFCSKTQPISEEF